MDKTNPPNINSNNTYNNNKKLKIELRKKKKVGVLQRRIQCPWQIRREVRQIWRLVEDPARFSHCFREVNKVADVLSNVGISHPEQQVKVYDGFHMLPRRAKGEVWLDWLVMPSVRNFMRLLQGLLDYVVAIK